MFCKLVKSFSTHEVVEKKEKKQSESAGGEEAKKTPIYLNVYDISPINKYLYWFGLGIYHSGIQGNNSVFFSAALACFSLPVFVSLVFFYYVHISYCSIGNVSIAQTSSPNIGAKT
jgi:hypothetical protein